MVIIIVTIIAIRKILLIVIAITKNKVVKEKNV